MKHIVNNWVKQLELTPHPEGGYYKEIIKGEWDETTSRASYSSIYFLLTHDNISHFHRIDVDEIWYYHAGDSLTVHMIQPDGTYKYVTIGNNIDNGDVLQYVVPKGTIFASSIEGGQGYALVGCMCQPAFEFNHFEMLSVERLNKDYPHLTEINKRYALSESEINQSY
ncbi:cupin domain-containing protein [Staphylococcus gallinarum]|jgi:predicted cupin superfamily sugar epimerase|uniref:cupin domain-containing protein n=1 Tax=Staphylococcus gallinarum TaxID=1293 RepID=UPI00211BDC04|nr:cupin domain-containing protein [Staphylococcus gallinarum]MCQ9288891.1 cupin domain-containing protein [Staphylococcus gallinarum]